MESIYRYRQDWLSHAQVLSNKATSHNSRHHWHTVASLVPRQSQWACSKSSHGFCYQGDALLRQFNDQILSLMVGVDTY